MSKDKYVLKNMTYEDYIYYNGKCREENKFAKEIKNGQTEYFVFFKNDKPCCDLYVNIKEGPDAPFHTLLEAFKESPIVIDMLLRKYNELKISSFALHSKEEADALDYIKKNYKVIKEETTDYHLTWHNGRNMESVSITIKSKEPKPNIKVIKGSYEDYATWRGRLYIEKDPIAQDIKKGELQFLLILNNDKYLDFLCVDENDDNKINLLLYFDTIVNTHKEVLKELKKCYDHLSFITDASCYTEIYNSIKDNYEVIEEKKIPYTLGNGASTSMDLIKIKL